MLEAFTIINNRYKVKACMGRGGFGVVYGCNDLRKDRPVAVKFIRDERRDDPGAEERLFDEAVRAARINHPNVVTVYDYGRHEGHPFFVMELLEGLRLDRHHLRSVMDWPHFSAVATHILDALEAIHYNRLLHGDLKPENVMVMNGLVDSLPTAKLFDFGLSRVLDHELHQMFEEDGSILGSLDYMAPEQFRGDPVDERTDLYSVGIIFYELLCRGLPWEAASSHEWIEKVVFEEPTPLQKKNPGVDGRLEPIIMQMIAKDPSDRLPTARQARDALLSAGGG